MCMNKGMREHNLIMKSAPSDNFAIQSRDCKCKPNFYLTRVIDGYGTVRVREIAMAFHI